MAKSVLKIKARKARRLGIGIKTIARKLKVSSSTVSLWCRDIVLSEEQLVELSRRSKDPYYGERRTHIEAVQRKKQAKISLLYKKGKLDIGELTRRDLFIAGVALYWAEGFKKDNLVGFANSDPSMIRFMTLWFKKICGIPQEQIKYRLTLNIAYKDKDQDIRLYWSNMLGVDVDQFQRTIFQRVQWQKIYEHPDEYHGVLRVRIAKSTDLLRKIYGWIGGLANL